MTKTADFNHGWAQSYTTGDIVAMNLSLSPWVFGDGIGVDESNDWKLPPPTGDESLFAQHVMAELRKSLDRITDDEEFTTALKTMASSHAELVCMVPRDGRLRQQTFAMLETALKDKLNIDLRRFTAMKLYVNPEPPKTYQWLRKFKGTNTTQVVINLSETSYRFFRFHGRHRDDVDITSMPLKNWSDDPEQRAKDLAIELRMTNEDYLRRIREASESGTIYFLLPMGPERRRRTMETFLEILNLLPASIGGPINLLQADIRRIYPDPTKLRAEH